MVHLWGPRPFGVLAAVRRGDGRRFEGLLRWVRVRLAHLS